MNANYNILTKKINFLNKSHVNGNYTEIFKIFKILLDNYKKESGNNSCNNHNIQDILKMELFKLQENINLNVKFKLDLIFEIYSVIENKNLMDYFIKKYKIF